MSARASIGRMAAPHRGIGNRLAPARYLGFIGLFAVGGLVASHWLTAGESVMLGFDVAALIFLLSLWPLFDDGAADIRARAKANDANRATLLAVTGLVMLAILVAVGAELAGKPDHLAIGLVVGTLLIAWLFSNTVYALHYAHLFYTSSGGKGDDGGLEFPGSGKTPNYWDFVYFAWTLGMTFQTSDVSISSQHVRKIVTFHCLAAFVFNLGVLAFTINVLGG